MKNCSDRNPIEFCNRPFGTILLPPPHPFRPVKVCNKSWSFQVGSRALQSYSRRICSFKWAANQHSEECKIFAKCHPLFYLYCHFNLFHLRAYCIVISCFPNIIILLTASFSFTIMHFPCFKHDWFRCTFVKLESQSCIIERTNKTCTKNETKWETNLNKNGY